MLKESFVNKTIASIIRINEQWIDITFIDGSWMTFRIAPECGGYQASLDLFEPLGRHAGSEYVSINVID